MNRNCQKYNVLIENLIGKGTILEWKEELNSPHFTDNHGTFRVTSLKINSWGSIYINLSIIGEGSYYDRTLRQELKSRYDTKYEQHKRTNHFKWGAGRNIVHQELKLLGITTTQIFVKRLTFSTAKKR